MSTSRARAPVPAISSRYIRYLEELLDRSILNRVTDKFDRNKARGLVYHSTYRIWQAIKQHLGDGVEVAPPLMDVEDLAEYQLVIASRKLRRISEVGYRALAMLVGEMLTVAERELPEAEKLQGATELSARVSRAVAKLAPDGALRHNRGHETRDRPGDGQPAQEAATGKPA